MPPVLKFFDSKLPAKISCNTSLKGLGAVLEQKHNRVPSSLHPIIFFEDLPHQNRCHSHGAPPHLKMKPPPN